MAEVQRSVIVPYSAEQMYELVDRVELYPQFMPWCGGASETPVEEGRSRASITIDFHHIRQSFTTDNVKRAPELIEVTLHDGPFRHLDGHWRFLPLATDACKVDFRLQYQFAHKMLEKVVGPVFHRIANSFVDAFIRRAEQVYGRR
jgi:ribosome-associated toxin RatA of RatAB toxin-antitoxin module